MCVPSLPSHRVRSCGTQRYMAFQATTSCPSILASDKQVRRVSAVLCLAGSYIHQTPGCRPGPQTSSLMIVAGSGWRQHRTGSDSAFRVFVEANHKRANASRLRPQQHHLGNTLPERGRPTWAIHLETRCESFKKTSQCLPQTGSSGRTPYAGRNAVS